MTSDRKRTKKGIPTSRKAALELQLKTTGWGLWAEPLGAAGFARREIFLRKILPQASLDASATRKAFFELLSSGL